MYLACPDLTDNKFVSYYTNFGNESFRFSFKWNEYCDCCFLSIYDNNGNDIITGIALTTKRKIITDNRILPSFTFMHKDGLTLEPTAETIKDYIIAYTTE